MANTLSDKKGQIIGGLIGVAILWWLVKNKWSGGTGWQIVTVLFGIGVVSFAIKTLKSTSDNSSTPGSVSGPLGALAGNTTAAINRMAHLNDDFATKEAASIAQYAGNFPKDQQAVLNSYRLWLLNNPKATNENINAFVTGPLTTKYGSDLVNTTMDAWNNL